MAKLTIESAVRELWYWQFGSNPTNFTSRLFELMQKADADNALILARAFPLEWNAFTLWLHSPDTNQFFKQWGFERGKPDEGAHA